MHKNLVNLVKTLDHKKNSYFPGQKTSENNVPGLEPETVENPYLR